MSCSERLARAQVATLFVTSGVAGVVGALAWPLMNLVRVAGGWALDTGGRISRELFADAFELVGANGRHAPGEVEPVRNAHLQLESLTSYIRRAARGRFYTDTVSFPRASGVEWNQRLRDADLLRGPVLEQVAAGLGLDVDHAQALTVIPHIARQASFLKKHCHSLATSTALIYSTSCCSRVFAAEIMA
jgi:hypothetical protein